MTPAAPASITAFVNDRIEAKPGDETPTTTGASTWLMTRFEKAIASSGSSFGASPRMPRMVSPVTPQL